MRPILDEGSTRSIAPVANAASLSGESYWVRGSLTTLIRLEQSQPASGAVGAGPASLCSQLEHARSGHQRLRRAGRKQPCQPVVHAPNINRINDDFAITRGGAIVHFGGGFAYNPATQQHEANLNGRFDFDSLTDFLDNSPRRYQQTFIVGNAVYRRLGAPIGTLRRAPSCR